MKTIVAMLATHGKYLEQASAHQRLLRELGYDLELDTRDREEHPWQAKRHAVRGAFGRGARIVYQIDADTLVTPEIEAMLSRPRSPGLHVVALEDAQEHADRCYSPALRACLRDLQERLRIEDSPWVLDWIYCYSRDPGEEFWSAWDEVAALLQSRGLNWGEGTSIGIAARVAGTPIAADLVPLGVRHLGHQEFLSPGKSTSPKTAC